MAGWGTTTSRKGWRHALILQNCQHGGPQRRSAALAPLWERMTCHCASSRAQPAQHGSAGPEHVGKVLGVPLPPGLPLQRLKLQGVGVGVGGQGIRGVLLEWLVGGLAGSARDSGLGLARERRPPLPQAVRSLLTARNPADRAGWRGGLRSSRTSRLAGRPTNLEEEGGVTLQAAHE